MWGRGPNCHAPIRGLARGGFALRYQIPAFCVAGGTPYPWTEERLRATRELIELAEVSADDKRSLQEDLTATTADTPRTTLAVTKIKLFLGKIGPELAGAMREILW